MMRASIRELRSETKTIVNTISHGGTVTLTYHGRDCAQIVPIKSKSTKHEQPKEDIFGMWKDNPKVKTVKKFIDDMRGGRHL